MRFKQIICIDFTGKELEPILWHEIDQICEKRSIVKMASLQKLPSKMNVECLLVKLGAKIDQETIDLFPNLKYIGMLGTGYGGIDVAYAATKGIIVANIADYATEAVAELTFGILLEHYRDIGKARQQAKAGDYSDDFVGVEIKGKKFGVIGLGDIGLRTAQLAQAFGADVNYWSRNRKKPAETHGIKYSGLEELLLNSDIITINLAYNPETKDIINRKLINKIKRGAIVINPSPMELVDFPALVARLKKKDIVFMLDHSDEMTEEQLKTLQPMDNCIVYPAMAYLTHEAGELKKRIYVDNLKNFLDGKPTNKVN